MKLLQTVSEQTWQNCARVLHNGGVIAYPTEGVFGIGCNPADRAALQRIIQIKQRDAVKGLILIASQVEQLEPYIEPFTDNEERRISPTWPGPVTWVVGARKSASELLTGGRPTLAVRVSNHPVVTAICNSFNGAVVSTSANFSGQPPSLTATDTADTLGPLLDLIVDAPVGDLTGATEIRDLGSGKRLR